MSPHYKRRAHSPGRAAQTWPNYVQAVAEAFEKEVRGVLVDALDVGLWRLLIPHPGGLHEYVTVVVERVEGGWLLSDAGEVAAIRDVDFDQASQLLICSGADVDASSSFVTSTVEDDEPLLERVLEFAHYLSAAPILWRARMCLESGTERVDVRPESATHALARETRERLAANLPRAAEPLVQLNRRLRTRGEAVRVPLAVAPINVKSLPLLAAAFVDMTASEQAVSAAKRMATWTFEVLADHEIPKYLVVRGSPADTDHFAEFYDNLNVTAVPSDDGEQLIADTREAVARLGYPSTA